MYLLIPGRHHLLTNFQESYLRNITATTQLEDVEGNVLVKTQPIKAIIFAVTSANHANTQRNPLPFYLRAIAIEMLGARLDVPVYIYGIDDVGNLKNFATYTIKRIQHDSDQQFVLTPQNTMVVCSTPVLLMYQQLGFTVLPSELKEKYNWTYHAPMPWELVTHIANTANWQKDQHIQAAMHPASIAIWKKYNLSEKLALLFNDRMLSGDGDLTETRDYNAYVRQMDEIAEQKYRETATYIKAGRIGDIGCAVGSWMKQVTQDERFRESDVYGIEVSRHLYEICGQRKQNGEFAHPFVFFAKKNAVTGLVFEENSMDTIHTSSLTHEIESYGSRHDLLQFMQNRYDELVHGGVWINRDVVGPYDKEQEVYLWLNRTDGVNDDVHKQCLSREELGQHLSLLSTYSRFIRFSKDFRRVEGYQLQYRELIQADKMYIRLSLREAAEFLSRKDYTDNWDSEMHETFCYWDYTEWQKHMEAAGFTIHPASNAFSNKWIVENRWKGKAALFRNDSGTLVPIDFPVTHMLMLGIKY